MESLGAHAAFDAWVGFPQAFVARGALHPVLLFTFDTGEGFIRVRFLGCGASQSTAHPSHVELGSALVATEVFHGDGVFAPVAFGGRRSWVSFYISGP